MEDIVSQAVAHHKFRPWRVVGDQRIVAAESTWKKPIKWNAEGACCCRKEICDHEHEAGCAQRERPRVLVDVDMFEDWPGCVVNSRGREIRDDILNQAFTLDDVRARLFRPIDQTPNLDWLVLTKRPENIRRMTLPLAMHRDSEQGPYRHAAMHGIRRIDQRRVNVWLGVSIACQDDADRLIPELLGCRDLCAKTFLSIEPLLDDIDIRKWLTWELDIDESQPPGHFTRRTTGIDWVIVGGESGTNARSCNVDDVRSIVRQCRAAGVPVFVKQAGARVIDMDVNSGEAFADEMCWPDGTKTDGCRVLLRDPKGGDPAEWPEDLRVREVPS